MIEDSSMIRKNDLAQDENVGRKKEKKWYRKAERQPSKSNDGRFTYRFPEISNSILTESFCSSLCKFLRIRKQMTENSQPPEDQKELERQLPIKTPNFKNEKNKIKYTWIGHSTAVIAFGDEINFMIDPVFSQRCSPVSFAGPKRFRRPAATLQQMPPIDAIFVSHDHYDHLDTDALNYFYSENKNTMFFAGLESEDVFPKNCTIKTLDWTQCYEFQIKTQPFKVTFVPVCHWSKRGLFDTNKRLWGGFVIQGMGKKIFYAGDTGYCQIFQELGEQFGGFDLSILPIGAYHPREFLKSQHVDPFQAVKVHKEIKSKKSVGVHWGTFPLGGQRYNQAKYDLVTAKENQKLRPDEFITVNHGDSFYIDCQ